MNVVVEIEGRDALPVWTLPYVTNWLISPDMLATNLADPTHYYTFPNAFNLDNYGVPSALPPDQWNEINCLLKKIDQDLTDKNLPKYKSRKKWLRRSIEEFW